MKGDGEEVGEKLTINTAPRSTMSSRAPVVQVCGVVEFASLSRVCRAIAPCIVDASGPKQEIAIAQ